MIFLRVRIINVDQLAFNYGNSYFLRIRLFWSDILIKPFTEFKIKKSIKMFNLYKYFTSIIMNFVNVKLNMN